jgi:hypothetical protein
MSYVILQQRSTSVSEERSLANECCCQEAAEQGAMLADTVLAKEQRCYVAAEQAAVSADLMLANVIMLEGSQILCSIG